MKVYLVFWVYIHYKGDWKIKYQHLDYIFKTKKQAKECINSRIRPDEYEIEEWEVD